MLKTRKYFAITLSLLALAGALFLFVSYVRDHYMFIGKQAAMEKARMACMEQVDQEAGEPRVVIATLVHCEDAVEQADRDFCYARSYVPTWYIVMDGKWWFFGPPMADGTDSTPVTYTHCDVYIDAKTGDAFRVEIE